MIYVAGPGHGGPGAGREHVSRGHLQRVLPERVGRRRRACTGFSSSSRFPAASRVTSRRRRPARSTKAASSAIRCRMRTARRSTIPDLIVACVIGDGEAETGPLATSWHSNKFLNPVRDGAVLPILHLNGYKIAGPTVLARIPREELTQLLRGYGYEPYLRRRRRPCSDASLDGARRSIGIVARIREIQSDARSDGFRDAAALADARSAHAEGLDRSEARSTARQSKARGARIRCRSPSSRKSPSTAAARRVDAQLSPRGAVHERGQAATRAARARAEGQAAHGRQPARQRRHPAARSAAARLPRVRGRGADSPARSMAEATRVQGALHPRRDEAQPATRNFRVFSPDETDLQSLERRVRRDRPHVGWPRSCRTTITSRPTAA